MVTNYGGTGDLMCSSTDVKPTDVAVNTRCLELDTGKFWYFNGTTWTETPGGGGGGSATLIEKSITANGTYVASADDADGYSSVDVAVPNTYTVDDNGKVVDSGALVGQTAKNVDANGLYDTTLNNSVNVSVPNSYSVADEGKVVSSGALVSQTAYPSTVTQNGTYDTTLNNSVTVDVPTGGGVTEKDVNFYDYDGTLVYSYTAQEFSELTELPANPTHEGLTAQGWSYTINDITTSITLYGGCDIGQFYATTDDKTHLYCNFAGACLHPYINVTGTGVIEWGDGDTTTVNSDGNYGHEYAVEGSYIIKLSNTLKLYGNNASALNNGTVGTSGTNVAFQYCLTDVRLSGTITDLTLCFGYNVNLSTISIPNSITVLTMTFIYCNALKFVTTKPWLTTAYARIFEGCSSLTHTPNIGANNTSDSWFKDCSMVKRAYTARLQALQYYGCSRLTTVKLYAVNSIPQETFRHCYSLLSITIPSSVTSIGQYAFQNCYSLGSIKFEGTTPPTVFNANAWSNIPTTCTIQVPTGSLTAYTTASNYPDPNTYTYVEY